jgi:hypothetical protein
MQYEMVDWIPFSVEKIYLKKKIDTNYNHVAPFANYGKEERIHVSLHGCNYQQSDKKPDIDNRSRRKN